MPAKNETLMHLRDHQVVHSGGLFQYDYGQRLIFTGAELPQSYEVHFANKEKGKSKTMIGGIDGVDIPDEMLLSGDPVYVWIYLHETSSDGETVYHGIIDVKKRTKPTNEEPTPVQQDTIDQTIAALNAAVESVGVMVDDALEAAKESGEFDGFSPIATVTKEGKVATITITDKNGTTTATVSDGESGGGGGGGTSDYNDLINKPSINGVPLIGNKSLQDLGAATASDIPDVSKFYTKPNGGIPLNDLATGVRTSLGKADSAYQKPRTGIPASDLAAGVIPDVSIYYTKPSSGIPASDLASGVRTSLGKADSAYQKPSAGIPAADIAGGVIPVLSDVINDSAGNGSTDVTWSADKLYDIEQRVADLEYVPIEMTAFSVSPSLVEIGSTRSTATLSYTMNKDALKMMLDNVEIPNTAKTGTISLTSLSLTANKTWTLKATDSRKILQDEWVSRNTTMTFTNKVKYGVAAEPANINDAFLNGLPTRTLSTSKVRSFSVNAGSGQYIWYALPSSYGTCTFTVGGFTGGFSLVKTFNHVNESGATVEYRVYRSDNANLGAQTITVN